MNRRNPRCLVALGLLALIQGVPEVWSDDRPEADGAVWLAERRTLIKLSSVGSRLLAVPTTGDVTSLAVDQESGAVWVGGKGAVSKYTAEGVLIFQRRLGDESHRRVLLALDPHGQRLWIVWDRFLLALDVDGMEESRTPLPEEATAIAYNGHTRRVWVATEEEILVLTDEGTLDQALASGDEDDALIAADDERGATWVASERRLVQYDATYRAALRVRLPAETRDLVVDPQTGGVWITTHSEVVLLSPSGQTVLRVEPFETHGKGDRHPRHLAVDPATGTLWVASKRQLAAVTSAGIVHRVESAFHDVRALAVFADLVPPRLEIVAPSAGAYLPTSAPTLQLRYSDEGSGVDPTSLEVTIGDQDVRPTCELVDGGSDCVLAGSISLLDGAHTVRVRVADRRGNVAEESVQFFVDTVAPSTPDLSQLEVTATEDPGVFEVAGGPGSVEAGSTVLIRNTRTGEVVSVLAGPDGSFSARITAEAGDTLEIVTQDAAGNSSAAVEVVVFPLPPETSDSGFIHGEVVDALTQRPLVGVRVNARGVNGGVLTDGTGRFAFRTPGTGDFTLFFERGGYVTARRDQYVLAQRHATVGEVGLRAYDPLGTVVTTAGGTVTDSTGKVQAIFPAGAVTQTLTVTATYLAKEAEFPLPMPEGTVFVAGAQMTPEHTAFLQPVTLRFANDLGFAPGTPVPFAFASHDEEDPNEGFYDSGMAVVTPDGAFIELQVTHFSCVALGAAPPPGTNQGEPCPTCSEVKELEDPDLKCDIPGTSSVCATDGNVRVEQRLASVGALGGRDMVEFAYTSATAHPRPLISARTNLSSLYFPSAPASSSWKVSLEGVEREVFYQPATDTTLLSYGWDGVDAGGTLLSTGAYHFRATSSATHNGPLYTAVTFGGLATEPTNVQGSQPLPYKAVTGGYVILNNQSSSPFGAGWGLAELERLHTQPDGTVLWTSGRGASAVMKPAQKQLLTSLPPRAGGIVRDANGNLYVARLNGEVIKVTPEGTTSSFATVGPDLTDLAFDRSGTHLYALRHLGGVFRIDSTGTVTKLAQVGFDLGGMALDSKGNVFVLDSHHPRIYKVTPSGQASIFAGYTYPSPNRLLNYPSGIVIDKHDNLYVSNNYNVPGQVRCGVSYISKITPAGGHSYYALGLDAPRGLALDEVGNLYVADVSCGSARNVEIKMISPTGLITTLDRAYPRPVTGAEPPYGYSYDLVAHPNGKLYLVTDRGPVYETWILAPPVGVPVRYAGPAAEHSTLERRADGRYTRISKYSTRFEFDSGGRLIARVEPNGNTTSYTYDTQGRLLERTNAAGQAWTFGYSGDGLSAVTDPAGRTTSVAMSGGDLMSVTHPDGSTVSFSYDRHLLTGKTDARGQTTTYAYDANGKASTVSLPTGESRHFDVGRSRTAIHSLPPGEGTEGNPAPPVREPDREDRYTDGRGFVTRLVSNALGAVTEATRPDGQVHRIDRDADNNPVETLEPGGRRVSQVFDGEGNVLTSDEEGGSSLSILYSAAFHSKPQTVRDGLGSEYTFIYDAGGNLVLTADAFFRQTRYVVGAYGLPARAELPDGGVLEYAYDAQGRLTEVKDQLQRTSRFDYDAAGNVVRGTDPANRTTEYQYDGVNRLVGVKDALGQRTTFAYEAACTGCTTNRHQVTRITDAKGRQTTFEYDPIGQLTKVTDPVGRSRTFTYDLNRNLASADDAKGQTISFEYDSLDRLVTKERPEGAESYGYDVAGNVITLSDSDSSLALSYDVLDRLVQVTPGGALPPLTLSYTYDRRSDRTSLGRPWGTLEYGYDLLRNLSQIQGLPGAASSVEFGYDALNRRRQVAGLLSEGFAYDLAGQLTSHTSSAGSVLGWEYSYDLAGNPTREVLSEAYAGAPPQIIATPNPAVAPTSRAVFSGQVAITSVVSINGQPVSVALDGTFQADVAVEPGPNTVLIQATRPSGASAQLSISISGEPTPLPTRLMSADVAGTLYGTDAQGRTVSVAQDGALSMIGELPASPTHVARAVDGTLYAWYGTQLRKLENSTLVDLVTVPFLPEDVALLDDGTWLLTQATTVYRFDPSSGDPIVWATLPASGTRLLVAANAASEAFAATVLAATDSGQVFRIDSTGQPTEWTSSVAFATIDDIALDGAGNAFVMKVSPDSPDYISTCNECPDCSECINIVRLSPAGDATVLFAFPTQPYGVADSSGSFFFINTSGLNRIPAEGNQGEPFVATGQDLVIQVEIDPPEPSIGARDFTYDTLDRLATATPGETYAYDPVGNRTSSHRSTLHVVDAANQLLEDAAYLYSYDLNGNLVQKESKLGAGITRYFWDSQDRLVRVEIPGTVAEYLYDPLGRRIQKTVNGVVTKYLYDGQDIVAELDGNGDVVTTFVHGPGIDEPLTITRGGQTYLYHRDGLGSITHLTDQAGDVVQRYQYDAYGDITAQLDPGFVQPYAFTGREWDSEIGLYYYRARYYDPKIGRFISEDPIGLAGGVNFYRYVGNSPSAWRDPFGLWSPAAHDALFSTLTGSAPASDIAALQEGSRQFDKSSQSADESYKHFMSNGGMGPATAEYLANQFIEDRIAQAKSAADRAEALRLLSEAMHTIQDSDSPMHRDADGHPKKWNPLDPWGHSPTDSLGNETSKHLTPQILERQRRRLREAYSRVFPCEK